MFESNEKQFRIKVNKEYWEEGLFLKYLLQDWTNLESVSLEISYDLPQRYVEFDCGGISFFYAIFLFDQGRLAFDGHFARLFRIQKDRQTGQFSGFVANKIVDPLTSILAVLGCFEVTDSTRKTDEFGRLLDEDLFIPPHLGSEPVCEILFQEVLDVINKALDLKIECVNEFRSIISHDVDHFPESQPLLSRLRTFFSIVLKARNITDIGFSIRYCFFDSSLFLRHLINSGIGEGRSVSVFLMCCFPGLKDSGYRINRKIKNLVADLKIKNVNVGIHPSFGAVRSNTVALERDRFTDALGFVPDSCRFHYLRWSFGNLNSLSCDQDKSVRDASFSYTKSIGFRVGTTRRYRLYDPQTRRLLNVVEEPLLIMDGCLVGKKSLNLSDVESETKVAEFLALCKDYQIPFSFLIHDNRCLDTNFRELVGRILSRI